MTLVLREAIRSSRLLKKKKLELTASPLISLDTEATGLQLKHGSKPFLVSTTDPEGNSTYWEWPVDPITRVPQVKQNDLIDIADFLQRKRIVFHHAKFDIEALATIGLYLSFPEEEWPESCSPYVLDKKPKGKIYVNCDGWEDTLPASHIYSSKSTHNLKELALLHFDFPEDDEEELLATVKKLSRHAKKLGWNLARKHTGNKTEPMYAADYWLPKAFDPESDLCATYATRDTERTILLWIKLLEPFLSENSAYNRCYLREKRLVPVIYAMEHGGITLSKNSFHRYKRLLLEEAEPRLRKAEAIAKRILKTEEFNTASPKMMKELLYTKKGFGFEPPHYTEKGNPSTDAKALEKLQDQVPVKSDAYKFLKNLMEARQYKTGFTYLRSYGHHILPHKDNTKYVLYPSINPNATDTTRSASSNPNGQNISKERKSPLRNIFAPPVGKVWFPIDYQHVQLRIFAFRSGDKKLIQSFREGKDYHQTTGEVIYKKKHLDELERRRAKSTNFNIIFGGGRPKVNATAGVPDAYDNIAKEFPGVPKFIQSRIQMVRKTGQIRTAFGYPLDVAANKPYAGANYDIQGTEGDIVKNAMVLLAYLGIIDFNEYRIVLLVHDELIIEAPEKYDKRRIQQIMGVMEHAGTMLGMETPVDCSIVETHWGRKRKIDFKPIKPDADRCMEIIYGC